MVAFVTVSAGGAQAFPGRIGLVAAGNVGQLAMDSQDLTLDPGGGITATWKEVLEPGWEVGGAFEWPREGRVRFETGARYLIQSGAGELTVGDPSFSLTGKSESRLEYATLPLDVLVYPLSHRGLRVTAGVNVSYLLRAMNKETAPIVASPATQTLAFADIFESVESGEWFETTSLYERWNTELSAGAGWEFGGDHPALRVDVRYAYGLPDVNKGEFSELRTRRITFSIATLW